MSFYRGYRSIKMVGFGESEQNQGWVRATLVYTTTDGSTTKTQLQNDLKCPWWTKYPLLSCSTDDMELNASDHLAKKYWTDE